MNLPSIAGKYRLLASLDHAYTFRDSFDKSLLGSNNRTACPMRLTRYRIRYKLPMVLTLYFSYSNNSIFNL
jgi:hypothetical protein